MSKRVLILVEGQTEERFIKDVVAPAFYALNLYFYPTLLVTKRVKDGPSFKGGVTNFAKFRNDALRLLQSSSGALVTTMLDYYALPSDFPGMATRPQGAPLQRVIHVEHAMAQAFGSPPNFLPFLALHEFEAFLFSSPTELPIAMTDPTKHAQFSAICRSVSTPEEINERPHLAPSKRIEALFPAYRKTLHGPIVAGRIGLGIIRMVCPHFNDWLNKVEDFANK